YALAACGVSRGGSDRPDKHAERNFAVEAAKFFPQAGLLSWETTDSFLVVGAARGGAWRWFDKRRDRVGGDNGYVLVESDGTRSCSQGAAGYKILRQDEERVDLQIEIKFHRVDTVLPLRQKVVLFKFFTKYILGFPAVSLWFGKWIKRKKILHPR